MRTHEEQVRIEDPSIRGCAVSLMTEAMADVERGILSRENFHAARARAIETRADQWVNSYGKEAADMAVRGLHHLAPDEFLSDRGRREKIGFDKLEALDFLRRYDPKRNTRLNRWWIRTFGMRLYGIAFAVLMGSVAIGGIASPTPASAKQAANKWQDLARCGTAKPRDRERLCRQFNSGERESYRGYDGTGAGFPREYELPRSWEVTE